jgi:hypothetical protein
VTVAYAIAGGLFVIGLLYVWSMVLDEVAERHRIRRMRDDLRRRQLDAEHRRNGVHDPRPQYTPRQTGKRWPHT